MKKILFIAVAAIVFVCNKKPAADTGAGGLAKFKAVKAAVQPFSPYDAGMKKAIASLGEPQKKDGTRSIWYAKDSAGCHELSIDKMEGEQIGSVGIGSYGPDTDTYKSCPAK